jgi:hypothetical protein
LSFLGKTASRKAVSRDGSTYGAGQNAEVVGISLIKDLKVAGCRDCYRNLRSILGEHLNAVAYAIRFLGGFGFLRDLVVIVPRDDLRLWGEYASRIEDRCGDARTAENHQAASASLSKRGS